MLPRVLIIVLCHNGVELTIDCLESLQTLDHVADILIVDNASTDGTVAAVCRRFPTVRVLETRRNLGYAAGNNVGLRYALEHGYDYGLLLNNDTEADPGMLSALVAAAEADPGIGIAGPIIYYHDRPDVVWSAGGLVDWRRGSSMMRGLNMVDGGQFDQQVAVDFVSGCVLLIRCTAIEQGGLIDERFGMYYEETEWCVRIARTGWRVVFVPDSRVWHKIQPARQAQSPRIIYYMTRNRLLFLQATRAPVRAWLHALVLQDLRTWCAWRTRRRWRGQDQQRRAIQRGWHDFVFRRWGMTG